MLLKISYFHKTSKGSIFFFVKNLEDSSSFDLLSSLCLALFDSVFIFVSYLFPDFCSFFTEEIIELFYI